MSNLSGFLSGIASGCGLSEDKIAEIQQKVTSISQQTTEKAVLLGHQVAEKATSLHQQATDHTSQNVKRFQEDLANFGKWLYKVENIILSDTKDIEEKLNGFGNDGWELIFVAEQAGNIIFIFKKPIVSYIANSAQALKSLVTAGVMM